MKVKLLKLRELNIREILCCKENNKTDNDKRKQRIVFGVTGVLLAAPISSPSVRKIMMIIIKRIMSSLNFLISFLCVDAMLSNVGISLIYIYICIYVSLYIQTIYTYIYLYRIS